MKSSSYFPSALLTARMRRMLLCIFITCTPTFVTSAGSRASALDTRFCTFTAAMSGSVPCSKNTLMLTLPDDEAFEVI